ncbi:DUF6064 family protein [Allomesorhizobium alhagi]|nr:DUF6064 family protein [Mesorhizobium alhagi]
MVAVPFLWTAVGGSAAFLLGISQDWLLLVAGFIVRASKDTPWTSFGPAT